MKMRLVIAVLCLVPGVVAGGCAPKDPDAELLKFAKNASESKRGSIFGIGGKPKPTTEPTTYEPPTLVIISRPGSD